ncbi:MAG: addiction module protein [Thermodesulfobacteriota bacterium]
MPDFTSVLHDACRLSEIERLQLIDALWETLPADVDLPLDESWGPELERRVAEIEAGTARTVPWETIRTEALARLTDDRPH